MNTLTFERAGAVGLLTLNRPERLNAISIGMVRELHALLYTLERDVSVRVLIVTGAGRGFCSGADLKGVGEEGPWEHNLGRVQTAYRFQQAIADLIVRLRAVPQPVIAAVNGAATGGGLSVALAADIRLAAETAKFGVAYIRLGLSGGEMGMSYLLPRLIGVSRAAELLYTGRLIDAPTALAIGLVSRVVPNGQVVTAAKELAGEIVANSPLGVRMTKELLNESLTSPSLAHHIHLENRTQLLCTSTKDHEESVRAFLEKRPAEHRDR